MTAAPVTRPTARPAHTLRGSPRRRAITTARLATSDRSSSDPRRRNRPCRCCALSTASFYVSDLAVQSFRACDRATGAPGRRCHPCADGGMRGFLRRRADLLPTVPAVNQALDQAEDGDEAVEILCTSAGLTPQVVAARRASRVDIANSAWAIDADLVGRVDCRNSVRFLRRGRRPRPGRALNYRGSYMRLDRVGPLVGAGAAHTGAPPDGGHRRRVPWWGRLSVDALREFGLIRCGNEGGCL